MCGIAGIVLKPNCRLPDLRERAVAMREAMRHRGPDDAGLFLSLDARLAFVNCRLAIRDLSPAGHMPMSFSRRGNNASDRVVITYNGEIYNADELRAELQRAGHVFRSTGDTEVVLRGYLEWGDAVVTRLRGMFAFGILTLERSNVKTLFLARDRLGIKPLYYAHTAQAFLFASELKGLLAARLVSRELDPASLVAYLMLGTVPNPRTIYRSVQALEPGCTLTLDLATHETRWARYWAFPAEQEPSASPPQVGAYVQRDDASVVEQTRVQLQDAVRSHLVSDVPLGAFLSGGLDSSAVVALMRQVTNGTIRTCAMVFEESEYSEAPFARAVAQQVGAEHYERVVTGQDVANEMERILWAMDQPTIDGVNTYFVSKTAREAGLTVALSGLGGDELFGGYPNTFAGVPRLMRRLRAVQRVPGGGAVAQTLLTRVAPYSRYAKVADALARPVTLASAYLTCRGLFAPREVKSLVAPDLWRAAHEFDPVAYIAQRSNVPTFQPSTFTWTSCAELATYTHNQLLRDTDVMSMAHSLEVRVPLLDHLLVESVLRLPAADKMNGGGPKSLLLQAVGALLPASVRERRAKQGFTFPFDRWLRGPLQPWIVQHANGNDILQKDAVARVWRAYEQGQAHWSRVWALAVLQAWTQCENV